MCTKPTAIHTVVGTFHLKNKNINLMVVLREKSGVTRVIKMHSLRTMSVCIKFQDLVVVKITKAMDRLTHNVIPLSLAASI